MDYSTEKPLSWVKCFSHIFTLQGVTECYECHPKPTQRTSSGCTIRNTPSEPIHCIVWAKIFVQVRVYVFLGIFLVLVDGQWLFI